MSSCSQCGAELPSGSQFCIECGAPAPTAPAATGPTERLREYADGLACAGCGTRNPVGAEFCVMCGRGLAARLAAEPIPTPQPAPLPEPLAPYAPSRPAAAAPPSRPRATIQWDGLTGGVWLIGLAVLFMTGWWWPGIMVLIGLSSLFSGLAHAHDANARLGALQGAVWMLGIGVIAFFGWWWPGMLVLVGISAMLGAVSFRERKA